MGEELLKHQNHLQEEKTMTNTQTKEKIGSMFRVSAKSKPAAVAGALIAALKEHESVELVAVGAGAVNQSVKAIAIAKRFVQSLKCIPGFTDVQLDGENKTGMKLIVEKL
jgi:stage V sporulation protein S